MKTYPREKTDKENLRDFSHLTPGERFLRIMAILLVGGMLAFIFLKILFF